MKYVPLLPLLFLSLGACSSVKYGDPNAVETVNIHYGSTDLQSFAAKMVESMNGAPSLNYYEHPGSGDDKRVKVYFGGIDNATSEHIDTGSIRDSIQTALLKGGKFRFVSGGQGQKEIGDQVAFQQGSGRVNPAQAKSFGKQLGADVVVYGTLRSIEKGKGRSLESGGIKTEDVYYKFTLQCDSIETAEVLWMEEKELRKTEKTGIFGG